MSADDDPEARIRDLERPLSDFGEAAELTVPSAGTEGQAPRGNGRVPAIVISVIAAAVFVAGAYTVFLFSHDSTSSEHGRPTSAGGFTPIPLPFDPAPVPEPPVAPAPAAPVPDSGVTITIAGAEENKTLDCAGNSIAVSGISNTVVLTGQCAGLTVSGIGNIVTVDSTPTITASGLNNRVTYRSGDPKVSTSGLDNVVERG